MSRFDVGIEGMARMIWLVVVVVDCCKWLKNNKTRRAQNISF